MTGLTIGDLTDRTGLAVSAIRVYETYGIVAPVRNAGGHRRYGRHDLRRFRHIKPQPRPTGPAYPKPFAMTLMTALPL